MKTTTLIFICLSLTIYCHGQTLKVFDAIAGTLLPKVVDGIKSIKESGNKTTIKTDRPTFDKSVGDFQTYIKGISRSIEVDVKSIGAIGGMASSASLLYDDLGSMETFINGTLLRAIMESNNEPVKRQFAFAFNRDYNQLKDNIAGVKANVLDMEIDQALKDNLVQLVDEIKSAQVDFESFLAQSGVSQPTATSGIDQIDNYLTAMSNSSQNVVDIKKAVQRMLSTLNSRLSSFVKSAGEVQKKVDAKVDELGGSQRLN